MAKSKKLFIFASFLLLILLISGCGSKNTNKKSLEDISVGTEGVTVSFLPNNPPDTIHVDPADPENKITVVVELKNKGVYPQVDEARAPNGKVYISGFDPQIINFPLKYFDLKTKSLDGKSLINLNGGSDIATFDGDILKDNLKVERYEPMLMATVCYNYKTVAGPSVCIDPDPYSTLSQKKVCEVHNTQLTSQGAPVAITQVDEEAFATKTQFKITIKNVGNGDVLKSSESSSQASSSNVITKPTGSLPQASSGDVIAKCDPFGNQKLTRDDIDHVYLEGASIGQEFLNCWPFVNENVKAQQGFVRLLNGEGSIVCELTKTDQGYSGGNTAYTTPLKIVLSYAYKSTAQRSILVKREGPDANLQ